MAKKKKKTSKKKVAKKATKKAATPAGSTPQPKRHADHRYKISEKASLERYGKALQEAGFVYVDEALGTNADVLEGKVKGWDRKTASDAKAACYEALNPQGAPPPGSYPQP